jgi:hypothetical protein
MDLTDVDHTLIIKNKIDPLKIFSSKDYTHELMNHIIFLIKNGIDIDPKLLLDITDEKKRYPSINSWPRLDSICMDILEQLLDKGIDIGDEKYSELRAGLHANESAAQNFTIRMIEKNLDFPMYFDYVFDKPREAQWIFEIMIKSNYSKDIPDFIFENIFKNSWYIMDSISRILDNTEADADAFLKYIDIFTEKLISLHFIPIIDKTNTLKKLESFSYTDEFEWYIGRLKKLLRTFNKSNAPDILLKFLKSTKFKKHIKQIFNFNPADYRYDIKLIKRELSEFIDTKVNESYSFKEYFKSK